MKILYCFLLQEEEFVKIIGMKYEIKPPRLVCLKLGILDSDETLTGESFTIKYHDMADVLDFLVLKPAYDLALSRDWKPGKNYLYSINHHVLNM